MWFTTLASSSRCQCSWPLWAARSLALKSGLPSRVIAFRLGRRAAASSIGLDTTSHFAPLLSIRKMPRSAFRLSIAGRPPLEFIDASETRGTNRSACATVNHRVLQEHSRRRPQRLHELLTASTLSNKKRFFGTSNSWHKQFVKVCRIFVFVPRHQPFNCITKVFYNRFIVY